MSGCSELCARFTFRSPTFLHPITSSHHLSSSPLDDSLRSLPSFTRNLENVIDLSARCSLAASRFPDFQDNRCFDTKAAYIKVCGRGCIYAARRIGESAITILHSTGIGRDVARLNSKLPRKLPLFPASQLRPTVLFHARFIDPRTILPRPPTQTRFRPVALSYAMVATVSLFPFSSAPPFFLFWAENSKLFASIQPQLVSRTRRKMAKDDWRMLAGNSGTGNRKKKKRWKFGRFP